MRGGRGNAWRRPVAAGLLAALFLLLALLVLDWLGGRVSSGDVLAVALVAFLVGAMLA